MHRTNKGKDGQYLVCSKALREAGCVYQSWRLEDFELSVLEEISTKVDWRNLGKRIEEHSEEALSQLEKEHTAKCLERDRAERMLKRVSA